MPILTHLPKALLGALLAVVGRILTGPLLEKAVARVLFHLLHALAARTANTLDDELVSLAEDAYYGRGGTQDPRQGQSQGNPKGPHGNAQEASTRAYEDIF